MKPNGGGTKLPRPPGKEYHRTSSGLENFKTDFAAPVSVSSVGLGLFVVEELQLESPRPQCLKPVGGSLGCGGGWGWWVLGFGGGYGLGGVLGWGCRHRRSVGVDFWEHSYYIDYRNRPPDYLKAWIDHLVNWEYSTSVSKADADLSFRVRCSHRP